MKKQTSPACSTNNSIGEILPAKKVVRTAAPKKPVPATKELVSITTLEVGDRFVLPGKRKVHTIKKIIDLSEETKASLEKSGISGDKRIIIILEDRCRQIVFGKYDAVFRLLPKWQLFIGPTASGKTRLAREIAEKYQDGEVLWVDGRRLKTAIPFSECTDKTKLIIVDDLWDRDELFHLIFNYPNVITRKLYETFKKRSVDLIITCDPNITFAMVDQDSTKARCEIISFFDTKTEGGQS